jgi:hypothetical protein
MKFRPLGLSADQNFAAGLGLEHEHDNEHDFRIGSNRGYRAFSNRRRGRGRRTTTKDEDDLGGGALKQVSAYGVRPGLGQISAIDSQSCSGNKACLRTGNEGDHRCDLIGVPQPF